MTLRGVCRTLCESVRITHVGEEFFNLAIGSSNCSGYQNGGRDGETPTGN